MLQKRFGFTEDEAGLWFNTPYLVSAALSPVLGIFEGKIGKRYELQVLSCIFLLAAHITFIFIIPIECEDHCYVGVIPLFIMGLCHCIYTCIICATPSYLVDERILGTAYGIQYIVQNLGTLIAGPIFGFIQDQTSETNDGYTYVEVFLAALSLLAVFAAIALMRMQKSQ